MRTIIIFPFLLATCYLIPSCNYRYDAVNFRFLGETAATRGTGPKIWIDTNLTEPRMFGGSIKSHSPYDLGISHADVTFTVAAVELTKVTVNYADGTTDPGAAGLKLPMSFKSREHESINSTTGGAIVTTKMLLISDSIPGVITRDLPLTLRVEGRFIKNDGTSDPFKIEHKYDANREKGSESWWDAISNV